VSKLDLGLKSLMLLGGGVLSCCLSPLGSVLPVSFQNQRWILQSATHLFPDQLVQRLGAHMWLSATLLFEETPHRAAATIVVLVVERARSFAGDDRGTVATVSATNQAAQ